MRLSRINVHIKRSSQSIGKGLGELQRSITFLSSVIQCLKLHKSPSRLSAEFIKNTVVKIIHRVDYGKDIELLRDALLLHEGNTAVAKLLIGHALVRFGGMDKATIVAVPLSSNKETFSPVEKNVLWAGCETRLYSRIQCAGTHGISGLWRGFFRCSRKLLRTARQMMKLLKVVLQVVSLLMRQYIGVQDNIRNVLILL